MEVIGKKENFWNWFGIVVTLFGSAALSFIISITQFIEWNYKSSFIKVQGTVTERKKEVSSYAEFTFVTKKNDVVIKNVFIPDDSLVEGQKIEIAYNPKDINEFCITGLEPDHRKTTIGSLIFGCLSTILFILAIRFRDKITEYDGYTLFRNT